VGSGGGKIKSENASEGWVSGGRDEMQSGEF